MLIRLVLSCVALAFVSHARAERVEFITRYAGERVAGAEVCFFRAGDADAPLERFLVAHEVRCLPADDVLRIPGGRWAYYTRHAGRQLIGTNPTVIDHPPTTQFDGFYRRTTDTMMPAATIDLAEARSAAGPGEGLALYISNAGTELLPFVIPIPQGEQSVLVPAESPVLVLRTVGPRVIGASDPLTLKPRERRAATFPPSREDAGDVLAWVAFPNEERVPADHWLRMPPPQVALRSSEQTIEPVIASRGSFGNDGALFLFRGVPPGRWSVTLSGPVWKRAAIGGDMPGKTTFVMADRPLVTRPAAALTVRWSVGGGGRRAPVADDCRGPDAPRPVERLLLLKCPGLQPGRPADSVAQETCEVATVASRVDIHASEGVFEGVEPGEYLALVNLPGFDTQPRAVSLGRGQPADVSIDVEAFEVFGTVRMDGDPVRARLEFATGTAVTDATGHYYASLASPPRDLPVEVRTCSGELLHTHLPEKPLQANSPHDINIQTNTLAVIVVDEATRRPVPGATVNAGVVFSGDGGTFLRGTQPTDEKGRSVLQNVPPRRELVICAFAEQYARTCAERLTVDTASRERTVTIALEPLHFTARLRVPREVEGGFALFVSPNGEVTERASLGRDGTFTYGRVHQSPEYLVFVSSNLPLLVVPLKASVEPLREIDWPNAPVRTLRISLGSRIPQEDALVGLLVGGLYVPAEALARHQGTRGFQADVYARGPLVIRDLLATAPLAVMLGPSPTAMPPDVPDGVDIFAVQRHAVHFPRKNAGDGSAVIFD